jgi:hypothetical protein
MIKQKFTDVESMDGRKNIFAYYLHIDFNSFQMRAHLYAMNICKKYCAYNLHAKINKQLEGNLNTCHLDVGLGTLSLPQM